MNQDQQKIWHIARPTAARCVPPANVEETAWDILLALHSDPGCRLGLDKVASMASVSQPVLKRWLASLERRQFITGARHRDTGEVRASLTRAGRHLLDRYLSAAGDLQLAAPR